MPSLDSSVIAVDGDVVLTSPIGSLRDVDSSVTLDRIVVVEIDSDAVDEPTESELDVIGEPGCNIVDVVDVVAGGVVVVEEKVVDKDGVGFGVVLVVAVLNVVVVNRVEVLLVTAVAMVVVVVVVAVLVVLDVLDVPWLTPTPVISISR